MKLQIVSDLHLEFGDIEIENQGVDALILSGDIQVAAKDLKYDFFKRVSEQFTKVFYVPGNHEYYHGEFNKVNKILSGFCEQFDNVLFLPDYVAINYQGIDFMGNTLWADANNNDEETKNQLKQNMNDFWIIRLGENRFTPDDMVDVHDEQLRFIVDNVRLSNPTVIVGHHCPSKKSTHPKYSEDYHINGGYSSNLEDVMSTFPNIKLWTHGHTHESFDYMVHETRVVCNPRGYTSWEENPNFDPNKVIEIDLNTRL